MLKDFGLRALLMKDTEGNGRPEVRIRGFVSFNKEN